MAYEKTVWQKGMVLTAENLNKIENALEGITSVVSVGTDSSGLNTTNTTTNSLTVSGTSNLGETNISGTTNLGITNISGITTIGTQETAANLNVNGNITGTNEISGNTLTVAGLLSVGNSTAACTINNQGQIIASAITSIGSITASTITSSGAITGESLTINQDAYIIHATFQDNLNIKKNNAGTNTIYTFRVHDNNNFILDSQIGEDSILSVLTITPTGDAYITGDTYAGESFILSGRTQPLGIRPINDYIYTIGADYQAGFFIRATTSTLSYNHTLLSYALAGTTVSKPLPTIYLGTRSHPTDEDDIISQIYLKASNKIILEVSGATDNEGVEIQSNLTLNTDNSLFILSNRTDTLGNTIIESDYTIGAGQDGFWITENITSPTASDYTVLSLNHEVNNQLVYPNIYIGSPDNTTDNAVQNIFLEAAGQVVLQGGDNDGNGVKIDSNLYLPSGKTIKMGVSESDSVVLTADDITHLHQLWDAQNGGE